MLEEASLPCGILMLDGSLRTLSANPYLCRLLGYEAAALVGKSIDLLLTVPSRIYFQTHIYPLICLQGAASELFLTFRSQQGNHIPVLLNGVRQEEAGQVHICLTLIPMFQRRQYEQELLAAKKAAEDALLRNEKLLQVQQELEQHQVELDRQVSQLRQRNDELEQFGKIISHDLQEPIRKITIFTDLLHSELRIDPGDMGYMALNSIDRASQRLRTLIAELQLYFTLTNEIVDVEQVDLNELLRSICDKYNAVTFRITPLPLVLGNPAELAIMFRHLIDNAVKFRRSYVETIVQVSGTIVGHNSFRHLPDKYNYVDYARLTISDNGSGFSNESREEVFQVLKKLHPNTPGIGLGLAMARKIAERHDGQITINSAVGKGTTVTVLLPFS